MTPGIPELPIERDARDLAEVHQIRKQIGQLVFSILPARGGHHVKRLLRV
jgi:hypothetical protein